jgi:hypothetical protein
MEGNNEELVENIQHKLKVYVHIYTMWNKNKLKHPAQAESICTHLYYVE